MVVVVVLVLGGEGVEGREEVKGSGCLLMDSEGEMLVGRGK